MLSRSSAKAIIASAEIVIIIVIVVTVAATGANIDIIIGLLLLLRRSRVDLRGTAAATIPDARREKRVADQTLLSLIFSGGAAVRTQLLLLLLQSRLWRAVALTRTTRLLMSD